MPEDQAKSLDQLKAEYDSVACLADRFREQLLGQLDAMVSNEGIHLAFPVGSRVKSWESISAKLVRLPLNLRSVRELHDLVGVRLIALFRRDAERLCRAISTTFTVLAKTDTGERLKEDQFGYSSTHLLIKLREEWLSVPSLSALGGLIAEVQVRTVSQHIWAAASHVLQYKNEENVPKPIRRSIHRVSALLETVDLELERVLASREEYGAELDIHSAEPLNADSLAKLLDSVLPAKNKTGHENYSVLLKELHDFDIKKGDQLSRLITKHLKRALQEDADTARQNTAADWVSGGARQRMKDLHIYFTHVGLIRVMMGLEFGTRWSKYMHELAERLALPLKQEAS